MNFNAPLRRRSAPLRHLLLLGAGTTSKNCDAAEALCGTPCCGKCALCRVLALGGGGAAASSSSLVGVDSLGSLRRSCVWGHLHVGGVIRHVGSQLQNRGRVQLIAIAQACMRKCAVTHFDACHLLWHDDLHDLVLLDNVVACETTTVMGLQLCKVIWLYAAHPWSCDGQFCGLQCPSGSLQTQAQCALLCQALPSQPRTLVPLLGTKWCPSELPAGKLSPCSTCVDAQHGDVSGRK